MKYGRIGGVLVKDCVAILGPGRRGDLASQLVDHHLHSVADTQDRESTVVDPGRRQWGAGLVDARGSAREDYALEVHRRHRFPGGIVWNNLAVDLALANAASDQSAVLGAEIDYDDGLSFDRGSRLRKRPLPPLLPGNLEVGRHLQIVAGGHSVGWDGALFLWHLVGEFRLASMLYYGQAANSTKTPVFRPGEALQNQIQVAVEILKNGGVVAIPTDTLYGLAASAFDEAAVHRVFRLKRRSPSQPLPLLLADPDDVERFAIEIPDAVWPLAERFWPGPLTLVLRRGEAIPDAVCAGRDTVALRVPDHDVPRSIARSLGAPLTGTSANRSGGPGLTTASAVRDQFSGEVDLVIDGGSALDGRPSTVLDLSSGRPRILRHGAVAAAKIAELCGVPLAV